MNPVIHWFRRDLRLTDNTALLAALASGAPVIPLFVFDPAVLGSKNIGAARVAFLLKALSALDASLREHQSGLVIRHGNPLSVLPKLIEDSGAAALYFNRDYSPYARRRDAAVEQVVNVPSHSFDDALLTPPGAVLKDDDTPYTVFTPFKKRWLTLPKADPVLTPHSHSGTFHNLKDLSNADLPTLEEVGFSRAISVPEASEAQAQSLLTDFVSASIYDYETGRNHLAADPQTGIGSGTSFLSPYFHLGLLSIRSAYAAAQEALETSPQSAQNSVEIWISELAWREFYTHILYHFPRVLQGNFRPGRIEWRDSPDDLQAWKDGLTGFPIVDAAMRQLRQTGWMPNRARMIVASFLTKHLLIDWREGEAHFMHWLIDGDLAANNGGWQWTASTGTDAQPYFRIFNPILQSKRYDPQGIYIWRWIPELVEVPAADIHAPWKLSLPPKRYPSPIVKHEFAHSRALNAFGKSRR